MLSKKQIENNINWLLKYGSAPVRFLTHKHLLNSDLCSKQMKELWAEVKKCDEAVKIFSKQKEDGSWCSGGAWAPGPSYIPKAGYSAMTPKYVTTVWRLEILGDMGFDFNDSQVKKACEYTLTFQGANGRFSRFVKDQTCQRKREEINNDYENIPCDLAGYLTAFGKVGMEKDIRLKKSYDLLVKWQREDGGWINETHRVERNWSRSCPAVSCSAVTALYCSGLPEYKDALYKALKFIIWHLSLKSESELQHFYYHGHSMVRELLMFSELKIGLEESSVQTVFKWLLKSYNPDEGYFHYKGEVRKTPAIKYEKYHLIEDDWLTYYMTRIVRNMG
jgi:hypothetical protein